MEKNKPIILVTIVADEDNLQSILNAINNVNGCVKKQTPETSIDRIGKRYVYGIKGIQELFNVSHATAQKYKDGILKEAVSQSGRKIVVDKEKALQLFKQNN